MVVLARFHCTIAIRQYYIVNMEGLVALGCARRSRGKWRGRVLQRESVECRRMYKCHEHSRYGGHYRCCNQHRKEFVPALLSSSQGNTPQYRSPWQVSTGTSVWPLCKGSAREGRKLVWYCWNTISSDSMVQSNHTYTCQV